MAKKPLPKEKNIYETDCPILYTMKLIGQKWKLPDKISILTIDFSKIRTIIPVRGRKPCQYMKSVTFEEGIRTIIPVRGRKPFFSS